MAVERQMLIHTQEIDLSYRADMAEGAEALAQRHCHDGYEILYVISGEGRYVVEGEEYTMREGTLMLIRPMRYHFVEVESGVLYERYVLHFSPSALIPEAAALLDKSEPRDPSPAGRLYPAAALPSGLMEAFRRLLAAEEQPSATQDAYARTLLSEIVLLLAGVATERAPVPSSELGARVLHYLNDHLEERVSLDLLARHFFVSKYYLCRAFKRHNGISIHMYVTQKRVMRARRLIEAGEAASAAAYRVGFGDYSAFYRAFVKLTGHSPVAHRAEGAPTDTPTDTERKEADA